ncbi:MAG: tyrosine-type recombinase/integrase [Phycisphaeraceae bacterium]|nr:tyrosine-type recombinase/integrase [Phycisphaeraceae bacterium]
MASVHQRKSGARYVKFTDQHGEQKSLSLGKLDKRSCETIARHVGELVNASAAGVASGRHVVLWLADIGDELHAKLAGLGLVAPRCRHERATLGAFIDGYIEQRKDVKASTLTLYRQGRIWLCRFLGEDKRLDEVTSADADGYRAAMLGQGLARATVAKRLRYARHFFTVAVRRKLIESNPFSHLRGVIKGNPERQRYVDPATVDRLIESVPDAGWRLLIALARYGGLRIPSEALALKWSDVDFEGKRFIVRASKTEHHADGGIRVVPIFPELEQRFVEALEQAGAGENHIFARFRVGSGNLGTQLRRYIRRAGLEAWPKVWQNLRASRATDLVERFPSHVAAAWLGHTERIADAHYRQVTDEHFARATGVPGDRSALPQARTEALPQARIRVHSRKFAEEHAESETCDFPWKNEDFAFAGVHDDSSWDGPNWAIQDSNL